jgi:hypothetical protein
MKGANTNLVTTEGAGAKAMITGFQSGFNQTDLTFQATLPNAAGTMPLKGFAEFVYNWEAVNDASKGYFGGVRLGQPKVRGDWAAILYYEYIQQEAALSNFTYSDFGTGGTNQKGPVVALEYQLLDPLTVSARCHFTNEIEPAPHFDNRALVRLQLDALVKF